MKRWDYKRLILEVAAARHGDLDEALSALGGEGWELTGTFAFERHGHTHEVHFVFRRPRGD